MRDYENIRRHIAALRFQFLRDAPDATPQETERFLLDNSPHYSSPIYWVWVAETALQTLSDEQCSDETSSPRQVHQLTLF